ncbi:MAG: ABC transporter permease [Acidobacteriota bacterium]|jgi:NitT/TauT family transport system permease protein|nr:ABC transporter permease [Acidobacteriota bacterium]
MKKTSPTSGFGLKTGLLAILPPAAAGCVAAIHQYVPSSALPTGSHAYLRLLGAGAALWLLLLLIAWARRRWGKGRPVREKIVASAPIWAATFATFAVWQLITSKFGWLPLPFFPGPDKVFTVLDDFDEVKMLVIGTLYSLRLLAVGFGCGSVAGFLIGVWFGWSRKANYWGMPVLRYFGPIPATAWIPLALVLFPTTFGASSFIIALAALFPMIVLTASGVSGTRHSHLEVARTLGATPGQLIRRVAIPSALPSIFVGLFMALSSAFITLIVAEMIGVKAGLGFYITWAQNFAEYYKVFAALLLMGLFFSTLMSTLFKIRDCVLRWQQGVIKW